MEFGNIKIDNFNSIVNFEGDMLYLKSTYLQMKITINGDIDFDEDLKIKNISNASLNLQHTPNFI